VNSRAQLMDRSLYYTPVQRSTVSWTMDPCTTTHGWTVTPSCQVASAADYQRLFYSPTVWGGK